MRNHKTTNLSDPDLSHIAEDLRPLATPITSCTLDPGNARTDHDLDAIAASLRIYGQRTPIVINVDEGGKIEKGNGTFQAATQILGWTHIAAVKVKDDPTTAVGYAIADNRTSELSRWDNDRLLQYLEALPPDTPTGFSDKDLAALIADHERGTFGPVSDGSAEPQLDRAQELRTKWGTEPGQLWLLGDHRLLCGDCTDPDTVQRLMNGRRAVLFATDPPYLVDYDGTNHPHKWNEDTAVAERKNKDWSDTYTDWDKQGVDLYERFYEVAITHAIEQNAAWYCWHASQRQRLLEEVWEKYGAFLHQQIIWVKDRPVLTRSHYMWQHEPCLFGWIRGHKPPRTADDYPSTVWQIPTIAPGQSTDHPTSKPVELFEIPMLQHTRHGEICYEPFSGSGSQIIAAQRTGRVCYALEIAPEYVAVALERFQEAFGIEPVLSDG